jgi:hypothetical protein
MESCSVQDEETEKAAKAQQRLKAVEPLILVVT